MIELNQTEWNVYHHLLAVSDRGELVPTLTEIATACGLRSPSHVKKVIHRLDACHLVQRHGARARRALTILRAPVALRPGIRKRPRSVTGARGAAVTP